MAPVGRYAPPLLLMGLIFVLSAQPNLNSGLGGWDLLLRKLAHMTEYGLLWFLWWRAFGHKAALGAAALTLGYAATDEWHQTIVSGRHGTPIDVLIDGAGVAVAATLVQLRTGALRRRPTRVS
jgi:VanZ family protein